MGQDPSEIREEIDETRQRMGETVEALSYKTDVKARSKDAVKARKDAVVGKAYGLKDAIVGAATGGTSNVTDATPTTDDVKQSAKQALSVAQQNPLGLAIGAVALGFLVGMLTPSSRLEDEKFGDMADQVKAGAGDIAQHALEHGKEVAHDVVESATETVQASGQMHTEQLVKDARQQATSRN